LVAVLLAGLARPAMAGDDEVAQGRDHARRATAAANLGNYAEAAKEYEAAYMKTLDANLLLDVGQAWQAAGEPQKALTAFRSCVRLAPDGQRRATCEAKLGELEYQRSSQAAPAAVVPVAPPMMAAPPPAPYVLPPPAPTCPSNAPCPAAETSYWPLWLAIGAVVVASVVVGVVYARQDKDLAMPITTYGTKDF
jgi:tetratricopeptide (TPR) repeat protein